MGELLFRTRLSEDMFVGMSPWLNWLPGKLLHVNIIGCAIMSAITGSSAVCSATVRRMSVPELRRRGYDEFMAIGTLSGSGTLGMLIPPSIMMMVYGIVAQVSIYGGVAPPTGGAGIGVLGALACSLWSGTLTRASLTVGLANTVKTTSMIGLILAGGSYLSVAMGFIGLPNVMAGWVEGWDL